MPKGFVETDHVNKDVFMQVLKLKKTSIRRLEEELSIECSDKTIRRSLNNGKMRRQYIEQIAKYLDVDSRLLTGELVEGAFHTTNSVIRELYLNPLTHIEDFPYFREEQERLQREKIDETLKRILSLFEISYKQFEEKDFEEQYSFQHDLGLKWDCVFLDEKTPYISVRRAWHVEGGEPVVNTLLKTPAAKRDVPIPKCLVACLKEEREKSESEYVISNSKGTVLTETQFVRVWKYITVRSTAERCYYTYVNGQSIKHRIKPRLGEHQPNNPKLVYTMDFKVTPHMLRHTYITNLIYKGVDPKTVQYLAGHENSKTTMDIYAKVKYNKPEELSSVVNAAFGLR